MRVWAPSTALSSALRTTTSLRMTGGLKLWNPTVSPVPTSRKGGETWGTRHLALSTWHLAFGQDRAIEQRARALRSFAGTGEDAPAYILHIYLYRSRLAEEVPGFAIFFPAGAGAVDVGIEAQAAGGSEVFDGDHVPGFLRDDVGDESIDFVGGVADFAAAVDGVDGLHVVSAGAEGGGAFELDAPEAAAGVEDEVVALAVAPGFGDDETFFGGFEQESGFGELSGALGVGARPGDFARRDGRRRVLHGHTPEFLKDRCKEKGAA